VRTKGISIRDRGQYGYADCFRDGRTWRTQFRVLWPPKGTMIILAHAVASNEFTLTIGEFAPFSPWGIACNANSATDPRRNTRQ